MKLKNFDFKEETIKSWNNTISSKAIVVYPKSVEQLSDLFKVLKKNKKNYLIRTGSCSYDSKSLNPNIETFIISLRYINKILKIDLKKNTIELEAGALIANVIKNIRQKYYFVLCAWGKQNFPRRGYIS